MPRPVRVEYPDAVYHVTARGNERRAIYRQDDDRRAFLATLGEAVTRFGLLVHAYCLMPNDYHLLVQTPRANLSADVGWLQTTYSIRFNHHHQRSGHLFQGRYKAHLVEADEYAAELIKYIHVNPVRPRDKRKPIPAERRAELERYPWSSHRAYAGRIGAKRIEPWLCLDWLSYFGRTKRLAHVVYRRQIAVLFSQAVGSPFETLRGGLVLGGDALWKKACRLIERSPVQEELRWRRRAEATQWARQVAAMAGREPDRRVQIWLRVRVAGERITDVARAYGYADSSGAWRVVQRLERSAKRDRGLDMKLKKLRREAELSNVRS